MKILIIYYSRTGTTRKVAEKLKQVLNADLEEIIDPAERRGALGYLKSGKEAMREMPAKINPIKSDLNSYDIIIIGTPIWAFNMSSPVRAFILENKTNLKKVAFFATQGGSGSDKAFAKMDRLVGGVSVSNLTLLTKEVVSNDYENKLKDFVRSLQDSHS
jgi:flavodoxin